MGLFDKLKQGLKKTAQFLNTDIRDLFRATGRLVDEEFLRELYAILVKTDMGHAAATDLCDVVRKDFRGRVVELSEVVAALKKRLKELVAQPAEAIRFAAAGPTVILVCGVNGSGKTTSIAKLSKLLHSSGRKVILGAGDTFRAAAVEQLTIWSRRLGVEIFTGPQGSDPASVTHRTVAAAVERGLDVAIIDTAGRLQNQQNLMQELTKIRRVIAKLVPDGPHETLLVLDATTGQNGVAQAKGFTAAVECTGLILAKLDGTAKGGVIVPIRQQMGLPVKYIGVGEQPEDFEPFDADAFVEALFAGLLGSDA